MFKSPSSPDKVAIVPPKLPTAPTLADMKTDLALVLESSDLLFNAFATKYLNMDVLTPVLSPNDSKTWSEVTDLAEKSGQLRNIEHEIVMERERLNNMQSQIDERRKQFDCKDH